MYDLLFTLYVVLIIINFYYRSTFFINFSLYIIILLEYILPNINIQHSSIYTTVLNYIATYWTINEQYIHIQLFLLYFIFYYLLNKINKKKIIIHNQFIFFFIFLYLFAISNYNLIDTLNYIPISITNFNIILSHTLVSIHPPLILFSILCFRILIFIYSYFFYNNNILSIVIKYYLILYYILSFSIILGSFWSINLFGWGGWWIWDPIENISFFYWILLLFLIHLPIKSKFLINILLYLFIYDYIFFCTFKLSLLNSLHIFKTNLINTNIYYFFYLFFCLIFTFFLVFYTIYLKKQIIPSTIYFSFWYILVILMFFYLYNISFLFLNTSLYTQNILNLIYVPLIYIINFELIKSFKYFFILCILLFFFENNFFLIFFIYLCNYFIIFNYSIQFYIIIHYFFFFLFSLLLLYSFHIYQYNINNIQSIINKSIQYIYVHTSSIMELTNLTIQIDLFQSNRISLIKYNTNQYYNINNNNQTNELTFFTNNLNNQLLNFCFNNLIIYTILNLQYIIIATFFLIVSYIYYKYYCQINYIIYNIVYY
jgi:cytochrome c biogenesis factor